MIQYCIYRDDCLSLNFDGAARLSNRVRVLKPQMGESQVLSEYCRIGQLTIWLVLSPRRAT